MKRLQCLVGFAVLLSTPVLAQEGRWPGAPKVGVRAGVGGSTGTAGIDVGNVGLKALLNDNVALVADLGLQIDASGNDSTASFALGGGIQLYLNDASFALRPYIPIFLGFGVVGTPPVETLFGNVGGEQVFQMGLGGGFGAEYFISKDFSISSDLILGITFTRFDPFSVTIATVTPGVQVAYYF